MRATWKCDVCNVEGHLSPKFEIVTETIEAEVPDEKTGKAKKVTVTRPKMTSLRTQDTHTGKMYDHPVTKVNDLGARIVVVQLRVGDENVAAQFCKACLDKFRPKFKLLWDELEKIVND